MIRLQLVTRYTGPGFLGTGLRVWSRDVPGAGGVGVPLVGQVVHIFGREHVEPEVMDVYWTADLAPTVELQGFIIDPSEAGIQALESQIRARIAYGGVRDPLPMKWFTETDGSLEDMLVNHGWEVTS